VAPNAPMDSELRYSMNNTTNLRSRKYTDTSRSGSSHKQTVAEITESADSSTSDNTRSFSNDITPPPVDMNKVPNLQHRWIPTLAVLIGYQVFILSVNIFLPLMGCECFFAFGDSGPQNDSWEVAAARYGITAKMLLGTAIAAFEVYKSYMADLELMENEKLKFGQTNSSTVGITAAVGLKHDTVTEVALERGDIEPESPSVESESEEQSSLTYTTSFSRTRVATGHGDDRTDSDLDFATL